MEKTPYKTKEELSIEANAAAYKSMLVGKLGEVIGVIET